jgi:hypothetical protein
VTEKFHSSILLLRQIVIPVKDYSGVFLETQRSRGKRGKCSLRGGSHLHRKGVIFSRMNDPEENSTSSCKSPKAVATGSLGVGARLGDYEIERFLGAGAALIKALTYFQSTRYKSVCVNSEFANC